MTDYCACGYKANMLCRVCKTTPTCNVVAQEHQSVITVPMPYGFTFDLRGQHTGADGVCPKCMPGLAQREYQEVVRPLIAFDATSAFEMACLATKLSEVMEASGWVHYLVFRSDRRGLLTWNTERWVGRYLDGMSMREFAKEFATSARNRRKPSTWVKVTKHDVSREPQRRSSFWSRSSRPRYENVEVFYVSTRSSDPSLLISTDGAAAYYIKALSQYAYPLSLDSKMTIPEHAAESLNIKKP